MPNDKFKMPKTEIGQISFKEKVGIGALALVILLRIAVFLICLHAVPFRSPLISRQPFDGEQRMLFLGGDRQ